MKTSKISIFLILALAVSMFPAVMASSTQTNTLPPNEETQFQEEVQIMNNSLGAQIRLLQLEKTIDIQIAIGNKVIAKAQELNKNTTELEAIITEMQQLKTDVQQADPNSTEAVQEFVDLKKEAINLTKEFRDKARALFTDEELQQLREEQKQIREQKREEAQEIKQKIRKFNMLKLEKLKQQTGLNIQNIISQMKQGNITTEQAKEMIKEEVQQMSEEKRIHIYNKVKEEKIKERVRAKEEIKEIMSNYSSRYEKRLQRRLNESLETSKKVREMVRERIREKIKNIIAEENAIEGTNTSASGIINQTMNNIGQNRGEGIK